jgi:transposase
MAIIRVGVDIAKSVFHVHGVDRQGKCCWSGKYSRAKWVDQIRKKVPQEAEIAMEACASAHYWSRVLMRHGYMVKLIAPQFVKPYVKSNKNDAADAAAIAEAMSRPHMRYVAVKSVDQQDIQALHRVREELVKQRTAKANQIRGLVGEYGIVAPIGIHTLRKAIPCWLEDATNGLTDRFRLLLAGLQEDLIFIDQRGVSITTEIEQHAVSDPVANKLLALRGIGPLSASALAGIIGDGKQFRRGRDFAASLGLTPRQHSTGGKDRLLGISKRGDSYLRKLLVHGARSVVRHAQNKEDNLSHWINELKKRKHVNIATVALANKTARIAWAIITGDGHYDDKRVAA